MENVTHRLKQFIDYTNHSISSFETACGLGKKKIDNAINRGTEFGFTTLENISKQFPYLDLNWLISGRGNMLLGEAVPVAASVESEEIERLERLHYEALKEIQLLKKSLANAVGSGGK